MNYSTMYKRSEELMAELKMPDVNDRAARYHYGGGHQQLIPDRQGDQQKAKLLILDEPTSSLTKAETEILLDIIRDLKRKGVGLRDDLAQTRRSCRRLRHRQRHPRRHTRRHPSMNGTRYQQIITMMVGREIKTSSRAKNTRSARSSSEAKNVTCLGVNNPGAQTRRQRLVQAAQRRNPRRCRSRRHRRTRTGDGHLRLLPPAIQAELWLDGKQISVDSPRSLP